MPKKQEARPLANAKDEKPTKSETQSHVKSEGRKRGRETRTSLIEVRQSYFTPAKDSVEQKAGKVASVPTKAQLRYWLARAVSIHNGTGRVGQGAQHAGPTPESLWHYGHGTAHKATLKPTSRPPTTQASKAKKGAGR